GIDSTHPAATFAMCEPRAINTVAARANAQLKVLNGHLSAVSELAFAPNGGVLASGSFDNTIRLWDSASGQCRAVLRGHKDAVRACAFAPNGRILGSASDDGTVRLWDTVSGECQMVLEGHQG